MPMMGMIWARKCGFTEDMFYPSSIGKLTYVKPIVISVESVSPLCLNNSQ
jgi:hypothetical protein